MLWLNSYTIANFVLFIPLFLRSSANYLQAYENFRLKAIGSLSEHAIFIFFSSMLFWGIHVFAWGLPPAYQIVYVFNMIAISLIALQTYCYNNNKRAAQKLQYAYSVVIVVFTLCSIAALFYPVYISEIVGWLNFIGMTMYQVPQIIKLYRRKSTYGLSLYSISISFIGSALEIIAALFLRYSWQAYFGATRSLLMRGVQLSLFARYKTHLK